MVGSIGSHGLPQFEVFFPALVKDGLCGFIPELIRLHHAHVSLEFRHGGGLDLICLEGVAARIRFLGLRSADAELADYEWEFWDAEILAHIPDEIRHVLRICRRGFRIDHVIESLEPDETRDLVSLIAISGEGRLEIGERSFYVADHQPVVMSERFSNFLLGWFLAAFLFLTLCKSAIHVFGGRLR